MKTRFRLNITFVFFTVVSCGYVPVSGSIPGGGDELRVPMAQNRTAYAGLSGPLTAALRQRLARSGLNVVGESEAPSLQVTILEVKNSPGMLSRQEGRLVPVDSIVGIVAEYALIDAKGAELIGPERIEVSGRAYAGGGSLAEESMGKRRREALLDELADAISTSLFDASPLP